MMIKIFFLFVFTMWCHRIVILFLTLALQEEAEAARVPPPLPAHRVVVLQPPLPRVGHGQAPVAVAHVDGDCQLVELEDAPARGLDLFAPALHRPVAAPTAFIFWGGAFLLAQNLLTSSSESLSSFARVFASQAGFVSWPRSSAITPYQDVESFQLVHSSTLLTFHGASFILHAHKRLDYDSEDIGRIITELLSKLQENPCIREKAPIKLPLWVREFWALWVREFWERDEQ